MPKTEIEQVLAATDKGSLALIRDNQKEIDTLKRKMSELNAEARAGNNAYRQGLREIEQYARQITEATKTPLEQYHDRLQKVHAAYATGKITQEKYLAGIHIEAEKLKEHVNSVNAQCDALVKLREEKEKVHKQEEESLLGEKLKEAVGDIGKMALAYLSVEKAIELVNEALEHKHELERESLDAQLKAAQSQTAFRSRIPSGDLEAAEGSIKSIMKAAPGTSQDTLEYVFPRFAPGQQQAAADAARVAVQAQPHDREAARNLAQGLMDVRPASHSDDATANYGRLAQMGRVGGMEAAVGPMMQGITGMQNLSPADTWAQDAAFETQLTGMVGPEMASQAGPHLAEWLKSTAPARLKTTQERLQWLSSKSQKVRDYQIEHSGLKPKAAGALEQMMAPGSAANQNWLKMQQQFETENPAVVGQRALEAAGEGPLQGKAKSSRISKSGHEDFLTGNYDAADEAAAQGYTDIMINDSSRGLGWLIGKADAHVMTSGSWVNYGKQYGEAQIKNYERAERSALARGDTAEAKHDHDVIDLLRKQLDAINELIAHVKGPASGPPSRVGHDE